MAIGVESAVESVELEAFATEIPSLVPMSKTFYSLAQDRFTKVPVSLPDPRWNFHASFVPCTIQGTGRSLHLTGHRRRFCSWTWQHVCMAGLRTQPSMALCCQRAEPLGSACC